MSEEETSVRTENIISANEIKIINNTNSYGLKDNYVERMYNYALMYISKGFFVIPCMKGDKGIVFKGKGAYDRASRDKKRIDEWFHPKLGRYTGHNIAIATGGNSAFVIDIDTVNFEGESGHSTWQDLIHVHGEEGIATAPKVKTPTGGEHIYFHFSPGCGSSKDNLLGPGVDVKGGGPNSRKGHVMAPPSKINGREYKWSAHGEIGNVPDWVTSIRNMSGIKNVIPLPGVDTQGNVKKELGKGQSYGDASDYGMMEIRQVKEMLDSIKNVSGMTYSEWLEIGMSVHDACHGSDEGLNAWDEWSKDDNRYDKGICQYKWKSFGGFGNGGVTSATLFYRAGVRGNWRPNRAGGDSVGPLNNEVTMMMEEMNTRFGFIVIGGRSRIIHKNRDSEQSALMLINSFYDLTMNEFVETGDDGKAKAKSKVWMMHRGRNTYNRIGMFVDDKDRGKVCDLWQGFNTKANYKENEDSDVHMMTDFVKETICDGDEGHTEWVLDWIANIFQDPGEKRGRKGTALVLRGKKGSGKGTLFNLLNIMIGYNHAAHVTDHKLLVSEFNGWALGKLFIFVDEASWGGDKQGEGALKGLITEPKIAYQFKGVDQQMGDNFCRAGFASNEEWTIPATKDERRFMVLDVNDDKIGDVKYWDKLRDWLYKEGGKEKFMGWLMKREIKSRLNMAPKTKALADQVRHKVGSELGFIIHIIEEGKLEDHTIHKPFDIGSETLYYQYLEYHKKFGFGRPKPSTGFYKILMDHKFNHIMRKHRPRNKGKRTNSYEFNDLSECIDFVNSHGLADLDKTQILEDNDGDWMDTIENM